LEELADEYSPPKPKAKGHQRYLGEASMEKIHGAYNFHFWKAQGHSKDNPAFSTGMICQGTHRFGSVWKLYWKVASLIQTMSILFEGIDLEMYNRYRDNYDGWTDDTKLGLFDVMARGCFTGLTLLQNLQIGPHKDFNDVKNGWATIFCCGDWQGGKLELPGSNLKIPSRHGDVVFLRSALFEHYLTIFEGDQSCFVLFTKKYMEFY
jgi:hypothetical protein